LGWWFFNVLAIIWLQQKGIAKRDPLLAKTPSRNALANEIYNLQLTDDLQWVDDRTFHTVILLNVPQFIGSAFLES
jgi:hypothetical protein